jgi:two-component system chemotaxis response regulator CheB
VSAKYPVRVLVVDDSAFARKVLRTVLTRCAEIEVIGTARDGLDALEQIERQKPDVITLDLLMPNLDGVGVIRAAPRGTRFVVVSVTGEDSEHAVSALQAGAISIVRKPTSLATERLYDLGDELVREVLAAASARPLDAHPAPSPPPCAQTPDARPAAAAAPRLVVLGTSTGGPQALSALLPGLPGDLAAPIAVALHIPPGYTHSLARRLDEASALRVVEAEHGMTLLPGMAAIAPGGTHISITRGDGAGGPVIARLDREAPGAPLRPSVDLLFHSAAESFGASALAVVLTGMGDDGFVGATAIRDAGGVVVAEAESSCIVSGMPRVVIEAGVASIAAPLDEMARTLTRLVGHSR